MLPIVSNYTYLGVNFPYNGACTHIKKLIQNGKQKFNQLNSTISNRNINLSVRHMLLLSVLRPSKPFGEIWAWSFCKVGVINVSLVGGTKSLACRFLDIQATLSRRVEY